jgi:hypothetical protein
MSSTLVLMGLIVSFFYPQSNDNKIPITNGCKIHIANNCKSTISVSIMSKSGVIIAGIPVIDPKLVQSKNIPCNHKYTIQAVTFENQNSASAKSIPILPMPDMDVTVLYPNQFVDENKNKIICAKP